MRLPAPLAPYAKAAKLAGIAAVLVGVWCHGCVHGTNTEKQRSDAEVSAARQARLDAYEKKLKDAAKLQQHDDQLVADLSMELMEIRSDRESLIRKNYVLTHRRVEPPDVQGQCTVSVLSDTLGLCLTAAVSGAASDRAACEAARSDDPVTASGRASYLPPDQRILEIDSR